MAEAASFQELPLVRVLRLSLAVLERKSLAALPPPMRYNTAVSVCHTEEPVIALSILIETSLSPNFQDGNGKGDQSSICKRNG